MSYDLCSILMIHRFLDALKLQEVVLIFYNFIDMGCK